MFVNNLVIESCLWLFFTHSHQVLAPSSMNNDSDMHVSKTAHKSPGKNHDV